MRSSFYSDKNMPFPWRRFIWQNRYHVTGVQIEKPEEENQTGSSGLFYSNYDRLISRYRNQIKTASIS